MTVKQYAENNTHEKETKQTNTNNKLKDRLLGRELSDENEIFVF